MNGLINSSGKLMKTLLSSLLQCPFSLGRALWLSSPLSLVICKVWVSEPFASVNDWSFLCLVQINPLLKPSWSIGRCLSSIIEHWNISSTLFFLSSLFTSLRIQLNINYTFSFCPPCLLSSIMYFSSFYLSMLYSE